MRNSPWLATGIVASALVIADGSPAQSDRVVLANAKKGEQTMWKHPRKYVQKRVATPLGCIDRLLRCQTLLDVMSKVLVIPWTITVRAGGTLRIEGDDAALPAGRAGMPGSRSWCDGPHCRGASCTQNYAGDFAVFGPLTVAGSIPYATRLEDGPGDDAVSGTVVVPQGSTKDGPCGRAPPPRARERAARDRRVPAPCRPPGTVVSDGGRDGSPLPPPRPVPVAHERSRAPSSSAASAGRTGCRPARNAHGSRGPQDCPGARWRGSSRRSAAENRP